MNSVLGLAISHDTTSETNDPVVYIHDREDHTVPELIIHTSPLIYIEQAGFPEKFITVALPLKIFVQIITILIRISKTEFTDGFLGKTSSCQISVSRLSAFSPELIIKVLCCQLVDLQKICSLFCFSLASLEYSIFGSSTPARSARCDSASPNE